MHNGEESVNTVSPHTHIPYLIPRRNYSYILSFIMHNQQCGYEKGERVNQHLSLNLTLPSSLSLSSHTGFSLHKHRKSPHFFDWHDQILHQEAVEASRSLHVLLLHGDLSPSSPLCVCVPTDGVLISTSSAFPTRERNKNNTTSSPPLLFLFVLSLSLPLPLPLSPPLPLPPSLPTLTPQHAAHPAGGRGWPWLPTMKGDVFVCLCVLVVSIVFPHTRHSTASSHCGTLRHRTTCVHTQQGRCLWGWAWMSCEGEGRGRKVEEGRWKRTVWDEGVKCDVHRVGTLAPAPSLYQSNAFPLLSSLQRHWGTCLYAYCRNVGYHNEWVGSISWLQIQSRGRCVSAVFLSAVFLSAVFHYIRTIHLHLAFQSSFSLSLCQDLLNEHWYWGAVWKDSDTLKGLSAQWICYMATEMVLASLIEVEWFGGEMYNPLIVKDN